MNGQSVAFFFLFIFILKERESKRGEGQREWERENFKLIPCRVWSQMQGSIPGR